MSFYGLDSSEKHASKSIGGGPSLSSSASIQSQAKSLNYFSGKVDDLTFRENSVKDISDKGRATVVKMFAEALSSAAPGTAVASSAKKSSVATPSWTCDAVRQQLGVLQRIRDTADKTLRPPPGLLFEANEPLRRLASLPIDVDILKRTKVAVELNHEYWKHSKLDEIRHLTAVLVREWRKIYRLATCDGKPTSTRTLQNAAADLEEAAYASAQESRVYALLVKSIVSRFSNDQAEAMALLDGSQRASAFVRRVYVGMQDGRAAKKMNLGTTR